MASSPAVVHPLKLKNKLAPSPTQAPKYKLSVKNKDGSEQVLADPKATRALVALMNQHAVIGGAAAHWGGPAAFAEIMASVHGIMFRPQKQAWYERYNFVNDAGHTENGLYALKANYNFGGLTFEQLKGFRSIESKLTGHGEAHLYPEGVYISNGPLGSGLPQAQGLALADKLIGNNRSTICTISDGGSMEGEAKEAFAAIPGLAKKGKLNPFVLIVSDNNTKLSGRINEDSFDMNPSFESLQSLGWKMIKVANGHDLQKVHNSIEEAIALAEQNPQNPVCVWCKTIKGYGVKETEQSASGGHGYPLKPHDPKLPAFIQEIYRGEAPAEFVQWAQQLLTAPVSPAKAATAAKTAKDPVPASKTEKIQAGIARGAIRAAKEGLPVFSVSSDLQGSTGMSAFHKEFPNQSIDIGVAEANMVSTAVGLSKQGLIPITDTFAQFAITKGNLPLIMAGLSEAPILGVLSHTGFQDAADGASHQSTTYLAATSSIPYTQVIQCSCADEAENYMYQALVNFKQAREAGKVPDSVLFFLGRENHPVYYKAELDYTWGKAQLLREGKDVTIVVCGSLVEYALAAAVELEAKGCSATVFNLPFVNHPDIASIAPWLKKSQGKLITLEDHQVIGGMGAQLVHALVQAGHSDLKVKCLANQGRFGQSAYQADHLYKLHHMDTQAVIEAAKSLL